MSGKLLNDIDLEGLGLLMFLIREKDKNGIASLGNREIARRVGKSESWVRTMVKTFTKRHILNAVPNAPSNALPNAPYNMTKKAVRVNVTLIFDEAENAPSNAVPNAVPNAGNVMTFEDIWKAYGKIGSKKLAKERFDRLSENKKKALADSIPYYLAFHDPAYFAHLSTYISREGWNVLESYDGVLIPREGYHIANAGKFVEWFNRKVAGSNIPQISGLTPARYRMLNICYTLCFDEMKKVMDVLLTSEKYIGMANKGMIDFDYIFKPTNIKRICEQGGNE